MGTNYYIKGAPEEEEMKPIWHIGKTSAAGRFCFECDVTLKEGGAERIHHDDKFYDSCPYCGSECHKSYASSFTFAMTFEQLVDRLQELFGEEGKAFDEDEKMIVNEYGEKLSYMEFLEKLRHIPTSLRLRHNLGKEFS